MIDGVDALFDFLLRFSSWILVPAILRFFYLRFTSASRLKRQHMIPASGQVDLPVRIQFKGNSTGLFENRQYEIKLLILATVLLSLFTVYLFATTASFTWSIPLGAVTGLGIGLILQAYSKKSDPLTYDSALSLTISSDEIQLQMKNSQIKIARSQISAVVLTHRQGYRYQTWLGYEIRTGSGSTFIPLDQLQQSEIDFVSAVTKLGFPPQYMGDQKNSTDEWFRSAGRPKWRNYSRLDKVVLVSLVALYILSYALPFGLDPLRRSAGLRTAGERISQICPNCTISASDLKRCFTKNWIRRESYLVDQGFGLQSSGFARCLNEAAGEEAIPLPQRKHFDIN